MIKIAPSLLAADAGCLAEQVALVEKARAEWLHFDIMDGHFVPNLSFGPHIVRQMRLRSKMFFDVHLMVENPLSFLPMFADCGADLITVHIEATSNLAEVFAFLRNRGIKIGVSLKPDTSAQSIFPYLDEIDNILVMTVNPGFGGQKFMPEQLDKIAEIKQMIGSRNVTIEVDGGINLQTGAECVKAGADILVAGNAIFKAENPAQYIKELKRLGEK